MGSYELILAVSFYRDYFVECNYATSGVAELFEVVPEKANCQKKQSLEHSETWHLVVNSTYHTKSKDCQQRLARNQTCLTSVVEVKTSTGGEQQSVFISRVMPAPSVVHRQCSSGRE